MPGSLLGRSPRRRERERERETRKKSRNRSAQLLVGEGVCISVGTKRASEKGEKKEERSTWNRPRVRLVFAHHHHHCYQPHTCVCVLFEADFFFPLHSSALSLSLSLSLFRSCLLFSWFSCLPPYWREVHTQRIFLCLFFRTFKSYSISPGRSNFVFDWCYYITIAWIHWRTAICDYFLLRFASTLLAKKEGILCWWI